ncbi:unnamed protein product [Lupinus luteus]|uniref:Uncharacterized protein n=1 Tax=Lupinus luteus TaxID=3873 RepID=A0AAV1YG67_LUPLU
MGESDKPSETFVADSAETKVEGTGNTILENKGCMQRIELVEVESQGRVGEKTYKVISTLGYDGYVKIDAQVRVGGILCLWDCNSWGAKVIQFMSQSLTLEAKGCGMYFWILSTIYNSPHFSLRGSLWETLRELVDEMDKPWCVIGDFIVMDLDQEM